MIGEEKKGELVYPPSEKEIRRRLEETERGENPSFIEIWRKRYVYRGIPYEIACVKHVGKKWNKAGMHCVLDPTEEWEDVWQTFLLKGGMRWLWVDTLYGEEKRPVEKDWTVEQMVDYLHETAKRNIDFLWELAEKLKAKGVLGTVVTEVKNDGGEETT